ncbi:MAG: nitrite/sulfite reductase [Alphaproteobacteria bacterium]|nr:nitrite/sulfite reductase [Alphaproteobacteria bacterium]
MNTPRHPRPDGVYRPRSRPSIAGTHAFVDDEIRDYDVTLQRFLDGRVPEAVFLEHRLRHGVYGQRQDGVHMIRSKLPLGLLSPEQLEAFADLTEAWAGGVAHLTTRQDIQVHFVRLPDTPEVMTALDRASMTSREACGNVVRNVTADPLAGVHADEAFDVTPYGIAVARFLLRLPDGQSLGRKFKPTLASTWDRRFNLGALHDVGLTAVERDGQRGFDLVVGGGLGAVASEAKRFTDFLPVEELLPTLQAILKVFAAHGEKLKRARARMKFLVDDWGIDRFRDAVLEARATLPYDPRWQSLLGDVAPWTDHPVHPPGADLPPPRDDDDAAWLRTNVVPQRQDGYAAVQVRVPQGDLSPAQLRGLAAVLRDHAGDTTRIGPDQSLWIRWVAVDRLLALRDGLTALGLGAARAGGLGDTVTCPGADTCKLGITTPRALARQMQAELDAIATDPRLERLRIHVSGCPNACAQHHIADIGLFGAARTIDGVTAPHFMLLLGGLAGGRHEEAPGDGFGTTVLKLPAARVGEAVRRLTTRYLDEAAPGTPFGRWARQTGRPALKALLDDLTDLPPPSVAPALYVEHGRADTAFKVVRGTGECAGAVVLQGDLLLMEADRHADEATARLEAGAEAAAVRTSALAAFDRAARSLLSTQGITDPAPEAVRDLFRAHLYDAGRIYEGVGHYFLHATTERPTDAVGDRLRRLVVEAGLFVEEAHAIHGRLQNPAVRA